MSTDKKFLKSLQLPGLSGTYYVADESLTESGAAADAYAVGQLPKILHGTLPPVAVTGTLKTQLDAAPEGSIYIMHA